MTKIQNPLDRCDFKQKFNALWHRAYSAIRFINGKGVEDGEGSVTLTAEDLPDVQPLLTAGENITIEDNIISATGGGSAPVWGNITGTLENQTDLKNALDDKATVASVESLEDEIGAVGQAGTIRNDISLVNDRVDSVEDEIGPETTAGTLRYKIKENSNDIVSIENEIDIIDGIIASHSTAINGKADKTYVDNELANKADSSALTNHVNNTSNPHQVSKAQVGLANVDNTSDLSKPISTATQNALNTINDKFEITNTFIAMSSIISGCEGSMYITQILPKVYIVSLIDIRRSAGFSATTVYTFPSPNRNTPRAVLGDDNGNHGLAYMAYNSPDLIVRYSGGNTNASEQMVVILQ